MIFQTNRNNRTFFSGVGLRVALGLWVLGSCVGWYAQTAAAETATSFRAEVVRGVVSRGEMAVVRWTLETDTRYYSGLQFPSHRALRRKKTEQQDRQDAIYRAGKDPSTRYTWIFTVSYLALRDGAHTLRAATVRVKGKRYTTPPLRIEVKAAIDRAPSGPQLDLPAQIEPSGDFFLLPVISPQRAYVGQQITVSFYFFRRGTCSVAYAQLPRFEGFWVEEIFRARALATWKHRHLGDKEYAYTLVSRYALFALRDGELSLDSLALRINPQMNGDPSSEEIRRSPEQTVSILPHPSEEKPPQLQSQDVGRFHLSLALPSTPYRVGQSIPLQIRLQGIGNLKQINLPSLSLSSQLRQISARTEVSLSPQAAQIQGEIVRSLWLRAEKSGDYTIPALIWWAFDPWKKVYVRYATTPQSLSIQPALRAQVSALIKPSSAAFGKKPEHPLFSQRHPLWVLLFFCVVVVGVVLIAQWRRFQRERFVRAALEAQRQQQHDHYLHAKNLLVEWATTRKLPADPQGLSRIEATFHELLQALLLRPTRALTRDELQASLLRDPLGQTLHQDLQPLLQQCDLARFAPWPCPDAASHILHHLSSLVPRLPEEAPSPRPR
ncbi:BatD family protein [Myxococcota bacterium]|nr:BatD family protein [Myxococcota bacterium]